MGVMDYILLFLIAGYGIHVLFGRKKKGCCGDCANCGGCDRKK